jgi:hypothetical protein
LLDGARLARRGVDVSAVVWDSFEAAARTQMTLQGVTAMPLVLVADQTPGETRDDQRRKGAAAARTLLDTWRGRLSPPDQPSRPA